MNGFEPRITGFCCLWCNFPVAKLTGDIQTIDSPGVKANVLSCLGEVEVADMLKAIEEGNDGVFLIGCQEDKCRHETGSRRAGKRASCARSLLEEMGIDKERIAVYHLSVDQMAKSKEIIEEIKERARRLGPI